MAELGSYLLLDRCPHCGIDSPSLKNFYNYESSDCRSRNERIWGFYVCGRCGGVTMAWAHKLAHPRMAIQIYPMPAEVDEAIPARAKEYLTQAISSLSAPAGAVMLAASAVDAMLKEKGYRDGSLYSRIDKAVQDHMITKEMAAWAHEVRLDANDQRHADKDASLPTPDDARKVVDFVQALGMFMFVLPARVERGIEDAQPPSRRLSQLDLPETCQASASVGYSSRKSMSGMS